MVSDTDTIFFPGNQRDCSEADWFSSYAFNFRKFGSEDRTPFGSLVAVNEHTLKEGRGFPLTFSHQANVLLIPIIGELHYSFGNVMKSVDVGQSSYITLHPGAPLTVSNAYTSSPIQFLEVSMRSENKMLSEQDNINSFELIEDQIIPIATSTHHEFLIGRLRGRHDVTFEKKSQENGVFIFEISGTCEVQKRLLLPGDGLSINHERLIEFEALTPEAIVLVAEVPLEVTN